ncbi:nucleotidyltransferase domain-containing protein [Nocardiopsis sp. RSe5-2]|uniref:Nucleotidyltransferase domain-containing protein n=1 Tax=Nocardiopsis endophytica TaxID=3018445 RepID=A0ABT4UAZ2_9ACTN|nr:nucleotidyltransferase domain-containing protein [Nocardiopsis endophytica]MDA2813560.1 nucleotidyltransferase domain-containing protein [Nocardiopsis endophytica]
MGAPAAATAAEALRSLPGGVVQALAARGIAPRDLEDARVLDPRPAQAVLLTGSYATGEFNPTSDLDLLVLTDGSAPARPPGATNHPSTFGDSFDTVVGGLVVNTEYVDRSRADELSRVDAVAAGAAGPTDGAAAPPDLPNLQPLEVRLVQRLTIGVPLYGGRLVDRLRPRLGEETVRASAAALNFVMALSLLEDTTVLPSPARELMCRTAGEALLLSAVNAFGPITYDVKHLCSRAAALAARPGAPAVAADHERALFADRLPHAEALDLLLGHAEDLYALLAGGGAPDAVVPMLRPFRGQWEWAGRTFA